MKYADTLRALNVKLGEERSTLATESDTLLAAPTTETRSLNEAEETRHGEIIARTTVIAGEIKANEERATELDKLDEERTNAPRGPAFIKSDPEVTVEETRNMPTGKIVESITRSLDERGTDTSTAKSLLRKHQGDRAWVQQIHARSTDTYNLAWTKYAMGQEMLLNNEERAAITVGVTTNGGYLVPTHLDASLILTNNGTDGGIRDLARVVTLTNGNTWYGVTTAGVTASWDAELVEVSDDSPAVGTFNIPIYKGAAFVQASIEAFEDINGLASDVLMLLADAKDQLEATAYMTGSGSGQPTGLFTALDANTNVEITSTTAATIGVVDLLGLKRALPVRYRSNGSWVMNPVYGDAIKTLGTAVSYSYSTDLTEANTERLLGRPVLESDAAPSTQTTTVRDNEIVYGDLRNYIIVDKPGSMSIQFIPVMFNTANNLPDGRVGWYMHFRGGGGVSNALAFRLLQDKTSA